MPRRIFLLANKDGLEKDASAATAKDMMLAAASFEKIKLLLLVEKKWRKQIEILKKGDLCLLSTHGGFGEDGSLQKYLEQKGILHTHSPSSSCAILLNKHFTKLIYRSLGIETPNWYHNNCQYFKSHKKGQNNTIVQKPLYGGSGMGIEKIEKIPEQNMESFIYEDYIDGEYQISVGVIGSGMNSMALTPLIRQRSLFIPSNSRKTKKPLDLEKCQAWAKKIHIAIDCKGVTKTDFLMDWNGKLWTIETDAIPGLSRENAVPKSAALSGMNYEKLLKIIINDAKY